MAAATLTEPLEAPDFSPHRRLQTVLWRSVSFSFQSDPHNFLCCCSLVLFFHCGAVRGAPAQRENKGPISYLPYL